MSRSTPVFLARSAPEPPVGSVVLVEGVTGTAYQRLFSTGRWHSAPVGAAGSLSWEALQAKTERPGALPLILVHEAPEDSTPPASAEALHEAAELLRSTGAPAQLTPSMTRADVAGLLITLRAYAKERVQ